MNMSKPGIGQLIAGAGGVLLIVSLFLPWADVQGVSQTGWEFSTMADVFFLIAGLVAIGAAITGGRSSFFRPDLSMNAATDLLGVVATLLLAWLIVFDFPANADPEIGAYLALIAAIAIMGGAGDYSVLRRGSRADAASAGEARQAP
ncbi:MAG TPA: hypothetical protein VID51_07125 [Solirubrobacterales bacterium]|jgi:hypothetical protein